MSDHQPIGIDFGTTKTLASRWDDRSEGPVTIRLGRGTDEMPTSVHIDKRGNYTFGEDAEDQRVCESAGYFRQIKRDLGRSVTHTLPTGESTTSTELIARFLRDVRERIEDLHGPVGHTVITVPALCGPAARDDLKEAAKSAGFEDFVLLEEPIAGGSAFLYAQSASFGGNNFVVFDWGGGTLDLAIIERNGKAIKTYSDLIDGEPELGGEDIDDLIKAAISERLRLLGRATLEQQPDEVQITATRALTVGKKLLSRKPSHIFRLNLQDGPVEFEWTLKQFEDFIANVVEIAIKGLNRLMAKSKSAGVSVDGVLLIGGSSEILLVARRIEETTGLKPHHYDHGQSAVGLGAMLKAKKSDCSNSRAAAIVASERNRTSVQPSGVEVTRPTREDGSIGNRANTAGLKLRVPIEPSKTQRLSASSASGALSVQPGAHQTTATPFASRRLTPKTLPTTPIVPGFSGTELQKTPPAITAEVASSDPVVTVLAIVGIVALVTVGIVLIFTVWGTPFGIGLFWLCRIIYVACWASSKK